MLSQFISNENVSLFIERLKKYLTEECRSWVARYAEAIKSYYMKESERLFALLNELSKRLDRPLKDLDDIKGAIDILRKTRDLELDMDDSIDPIEVCLIGLGVCLSHILL